MFVPGRAEETFECPGCGLKYRARKEAMPLVRSGRFDCISCNAAIHEWSGFYDFTNWWPAPNQRIQSLSE
jgi:predicted RNA-binding Zn-ribbon protein involved in translation (DUF1610 family)